MDQVQIWISVIGGGLGILVSTLFLLGHFRRKPSIVEVYVEQVLNSEFDGEVIGLNVEIINKSSQSITISEALFEFDGYSDMVLDVRAKSGRGLSRRGLKGQVIEAGGILYAAVDTSPQKIDAETAELLLEQPNGHVWVLHSLSSKPVKSETTNVNLEAAGWQLTSKSRKTPART